MNGWTENFDLSESIYIHKLLWQNCIYTFTSIRVELGIGTGDESRRRIHVSISFTSCITIDDADSLVEPDKIDQTESLLRIIERNESNLGFQIILIKGTL
jgi:hypothetical protein